MARFVTSAYTGELVTEIPRFKDFIEYLQDKSAHGVRDYWTRELEGMNSVQFPSLPTVDYKPIAASSCSHHCPPVARVEGVSRTALLRAALATVLECHTGSADVCFGTVVSGRSEPLPNLNAMRGCTISSIPVRLELTGLKNVMDLLNCAEGKIKEQSGFEHYGLPNIARLKDDGRRACDFQTLLIVQRSRKTMKIQTPLGTWSRLEAGHGASSQALTIECCLEEGGIDMRAWYDEKVLEEWRVQRLLRQVAQVARQFATSPEQHLRDIKLATDEDLRDILRRNKFVPASNDVCVHDLIADSVRRCPEAPAISAWDGDLTYSQLDDLSNRVAYDLVCHGVSAGSVVPLLFHKSMWMPVAALAVMKTGGSSLAIDATQPPERVRLLLQQVQPGFLVCSDATQILASRCYSGPVVIVGHESLSQRAAADVELPTVDPSSALYIVFTSGSSGTPKAVIITHKNFSTFVQAGQERQLFGQDDRVVDFASYAFDVSWSNLINELTAGACLCIPSEEQRREDLTQSILSLRGTYVHLTPTVAKTLDPFMIPCLKKVNLGGELVLAEDFAHWQDRVELIVTYGPAECTVTTTCANIRLGQNGMGYPIASNVWVVREGQLCPIGAVGELWLEGPLVGNGYLNDFESTQVAFIDDPSWLTQVDQSLYPGDKSGIVYKTDDLVRLNANGSLSFVGRKDNQVKIGGQRRELEEVEHHVHSAF